MPCTRCTPKVVPTYLQAAPEPIPKPILVGAFLFTLALIFGGDVLEKRLEKRRNR